MPYEKFPQWDRRSLIKEDAHLGRSQGTARGMFQYGTDLVHAHAREPLDKLGNLRPAFEILEQGSHGHAGATEHPRPAHASWVPLDCGTSRPIDHAQRILTAARLRPYACFLPVFRRLWP